MELDNTQQKLKTFTFDEVKKHNTLKDNWVVVSGKVYNISSWADKHPGGKMTLLGCAGKDATDTVELFHGKVIHKYLPNFYIGNIEKVNKVMTEDQKKSFALLQDFRKLQDQLKKDGMYKIRYSYQIVKTMLLLVFWSVTWAFYYYGHQYQNVYLQLLGAVFLALYFQQTAFMGHDSGHNLVSHNRTFDSIYGIFIGNFCTGIGMAWWKDSHNCHHVVPNLIQYDPDIQHLPFLSLTNKFFKSLYSFYHERILKFDKFGQLLVSYQDYFFYPVMGFARYFLYVQTWLMLLGLSPRRAEWPKLEITMMLGFFGWMTYLHSFCLSWNVVFLCIFISHFFAGILHIQITLSHFTMELIDGNEVYQIDKPEENFLEVQMRSTQDISCPWYMDWFHGGLQFQLEHHLFPRVPRHNLGKLRKDYLIPLLKKHNRPVLSMDFIAANKYLLQLLKKIAKEAQQGKFVKIEDSLIWDGINLRG